MPQDDEGGFRGLPQGLLGIRFGAILYYSPTALSKERPSYYAVWGRELFLRFLCLGQGAVLKVPLAGRVHAKCRVFGFETTANRFLCRCHCILHINGLWDGFGVASGRVLDGGRLA